MSFSLIACQRINHYHPQFSINHKGMRALVEVMREVGIITGEVARC